MALQGGKGGKTTWSARVIQTLADFSEQVVAAQFGRDGYLYMLAHDGAPRGKVIRLKLPAIELRDGRFLAARIPFATAETVVRESDATIEAFLPTATRLYVLDQLGGPSQLRRLRSRRQSTGSRKTPNRSPPSPASCRSSATTSCTTAKPTSTPPAWFHYAAATGEAGRPRWPKTSPADFSNCEAVRGDSDIQGTVRKSPLNIIRLKNSHQMGDSPCIVWGYGGFGGERDAGLFPAPPLLRASRAACTRSP